MNKENMVSSYNRILLSLNKEINHIICNKMDEPWGHNAKWSKPDTKRKIKFDCTCLRYLK